MGSMLRRLLTAALLLLSVGFTAAAQPADPHHLTDVIYGRLPGVALTMDVFEPAKPNGAGVLFMVSGGWVSKHEGVNPGLAKMFTDRGYTFFEVVHGAQPKYTIPEIVPQIQRAVRFIRFHAADYGVDPNRLGITGASSGGHLSLMIGATGADGDPKAPDAVDRVSSAVQAVACFFPPTDFLNYGATDTRALLGTLNAFSPAFGVTAATPLDERERIAKQDSPMTYMTAKMPPTLIIHGDADPLVPLQQSQILMAKFAELKVPHQLVVHPGGGHGWAGMEKDIPTLIDWFDKYIGKSG